MKHQVFLVITLLALLTSGFAQDALPPAATLDTLLNYAMEHSFSIQQAKEQIEEQEGLIIEIKSAILPNASISSSYSEKDEELISGEILPGAGATTNWAVSLEVNQLLYSGGGIRSSLKAQKYARDAVEYSLLSTIDQVVFEVRARFYEALLAREQIQVEEQNVAYLSEQLKTAKDRFEANTISKFDLLRAEVELANAQPALIRTRNNYRTAVDELYQVIGYQSLNYHAYDGVEILGELAFNPVSYRFDDALDKALSSRPELQQLDTVIKAYEAGVDVAKAGYYPNVSLYGGYDLDKSPISDQFSDSLKGWKVGIRSSWAIFDGRATRGKMIQARSQLRQAELDKRELSLAIEVEVRRAVSALQEASELAEAAGKVVLQAEEALRLAEIRYEVGAATQLELLQSRVSLTQAKTNLLSANYSYLIAVAQLSRATGDNNI
jgi:outer membrane protein